MESRPPLPIDMSGPTPTTYSPRNKPLYETNSPAYSFGRKDPEISRLFCTFIACLFFFCVSHFNYCFIALKLTQQISLSLAA